MYRLNKSKLLISITAIVLCLCVAAVCILPTLYGGAGPLKRIERFRNGENCITSFLDSAAIMLARKSGVFDLTVNSVPGELIYETDIKNNEMQFYWVLRDENNPKAKYILMKDGVRYSFSMDSEGWQFDGKDSETTDFKRLFVSLACILSEQDVDTNTLEQDLNGLIGLDLSQYFEFRVVPTVIRSLVNDFGDSYLQTVSGYEFNRDGLELKYSFQPTDSKALADRINALLQPAYTGKTQTIVNIAGLAGGIADWFGYDLYSLLFKTDLSFTVGAVSGELKSLHIQTDSSDIQLQSVKYGGCEININSPSLESLIILNTEN